MRHPSERGRCDGHDDGCREEEQRQHDEERPPPHSGRQPGRTDATGQRTSLRLRLSWAAWDAWRLFELIVAVGACLRYVSASCNVKIRESERSVRTFNQVATEVLRPDGVGCHIVTAGVLDWTWRPALQIPIRRAGLEGEGAMRDADEQVPAAL